MVNKIWGT